MVSGYPGPRGRLWWGHGARHSWGRDRKEAEAEVGLRLGLALDEVKDEGWVGLK